MVKPRPARPTVQFIDTYGEFSRDLYVEVRAYECFKYLHVGLINELKRKSLPASAEAVGLENGQGLHHFINQSPWRAEELKKRRLEITLKLVEAREIQVIIDETGDPKKGEKTDYAKRQYSGDIGKVEKGIVSVNAYGYGEGMVFPLSFKVIKPQGKLKEGERYRTQPESGAEIVKELREMGFNIKRVLADSLSGESDSNFISIIEELEIEYAVGIRSNHGVWLPQVPKVRVNQWRAFPHIRWDRKEEVRSIREIIYGQRRKIQYWEITTDKETVPESATWLVMTRIPHLKYGDVCAIYGVRAWTENGFRNSKNELGWADFRVPHYEKIEKWWEWVMSAYLMVCLSSQSFNPSATPVPELFQQYELWEQGKGWKNLLNNLHLI